MGEREDIREYVIEHRLSSVRRVIAVSGGKGGTGKSLTAAVLSLILAERYKVGLLDLDISSPTVHLILGACCEKPIEDNGLIPPEICGVKVMSVAFFAGERAVPLRGSSLSDILKEILTITRWGEIDFLIIDMPPGFGEAMMELLKLVRRVEFILVTTPSILSAEVVRRMACMLCEMGKRILCVVQNMSDPEFPVHPAAGGISGAIGERSTFNVCFDPCVEHAIGNAENLLKTRFAHELRCVVEAIESRF